MVRSCSVYMCTNRDDAKGKEKGVSFFRFPKDAKKRRLRPFIFGWHSDDPADENNVPTIFSYKEKLVNAERENRAARRNIQKDLREAECKQKEQKNRQLSFSTFIHSSYTKSRDEEPSSDTEGLVIEPDDVDIGVRHTRDEGVQCDPDPLLLENLALKSKIRRLQGLQWSVDKIKDDDTKTKFYSGLPSFAVFMWLFKGENCTKEKACDSPFVQFLPDLAFSLTPSPLLNEQTQAFPADKMRPFMAVSIGSSSVLTSSSITTSGVSSGMVHK
uniref:Uncharacterized protein n=1 Tax=Magallana gigas TaxID=29159 RepID=K1QTH9_MAGGI